jgi:hypothetical protein
MNHSISSFSIIGNDNPPPFMRTDPRDPPPALFERCFDKAKPKCPSGK